MLISANMKARCGTSQVLAGLLYAAAVWLLSLLTSVLGIPSWNDGYGDVNNYRNVYSLMMSSCVIFGHFQMINTHTSTSVQQGQALTTKCHLRDGVWKHLSVFADVSILSYTLSFSLHTLSY